MINNPSMATYQLSESPLDLRAPVFARLRKGSWWMRLTILVLVDYVLLFLAWFVSDYYASSVHLPESIPSNFSSMLITTAIQIGALAVQGNYQAGNKRSDYINIIKTLVFAQGLIIIIGFLYQPLIEGTRSELIISLLISTSFICVGRFAINLLLEFLRGKKILGCYPAFIIYDSEDKDKIKTFVEKEKRYIICGNDSAQSLDRYNRQATFEKLNQLGVTEVFISWDAIKNRMFTCWLFQASGITVHLLQTEFKPIYRDVEFTNIGGIPCLSFYCPTIPGGGFWIKRCFDFCFTSLFLIFSFPIYILIALAIKLDSPGPVFYRQTRVGLRGEEFKVWKFRTMKTNAEQLQKELEALNETKDGVLFKIKDDPRVTRVGKYLRRYSLDELPQLFNVLYGEMSLIGPRPLPTRDIDKFAERHFIRQEVLPGITGLWQVSGRSDVLDFEQVINLDMRYIENWSLWLDLEILFKTVMVVLKKEGAY